MISEVKSLLQSKFYMKDLGKLRYFLGIEVARSSKGIVLNQRKYALDILKEVGLTGCKPVSIPIEPNTKLTSVEYDQSIGSNPKDDPILSNINSYQKLVGKLIDLSSTRPDICYIVQLLSQFMHCPKHSHMEAVKRVLKYTKGTAGYGILLSSKSELKLEAWSDSDWGSCPMSRRSLTGYCVKIGDSLLSWKTKKQNTVSRSSAEAEYRSMASTSCELIWLQRIFEDLGVCGLHPATLRCDNKAALYISSNPVFHERTKHIELDCHFIRGKIQDGSIKTEFVKTNQQLADVLTKPLWKTQFWNLIDKLGVFNIYPNTRLEGEYQEKQG